MVPLVRFAFPADESVLATDYKTFVRLIYDIDKKGRNEVAILHDDGVVFVSGGLVTGSGTGTSDSITAKLSNGEAVMTARAVANWGDILSAINVSSGGNAIPTNNLPQKGDGWSGMERAFEKAIMKMPVPVVSVVDINRGQNRVKVSENLGQLGGRRNRK